MIQKGNSIVELTVYTFSHFCVDLSCFYVLFSWYSSGTHSVHEVTIGFLTYNVIAFGLQPVIGYLCDKYRGVPVEIIGFPLLIAGLFMMHIPIIAISLSGVGNAFFHIAGGIDSLENSGGKMMRSGVFVSSGALGVAFGTLAGKAENISITVPMVLLILCLVMLTVIYLRRLTLKSERVKSEEEPVHHVHFALIKSDLKPGVIILLAVVSIMIRSYAGSIIPIQWRTTNLLFLFPAIGAFCGKFIGGFVADRFGAKITAVTSLLISTVLLGFGFFNPCIYIIGILLFNMSMSITLCAIVSVLPTNSGLAFGITTIALLCGSIPTYFISIAHPILFFDILTVISTICLAFILCRGEGNEKVSR